MSGGLTGQAARASLSLQQLWPRRAPRPAGDEVLVLAPAAHGSFGDEAMVGGIRSLTKHAGVTLNLLAPGDPEGWLQAGLEHASSLDRYVVPPGFTVRSSAVSLHPRCGAVIAIGADSIDGAYGLRSIAQMVSVLNVAAGLGRRARLANFSVGRHPSSGARSILSCLDPRVVSVARDEPSAQRAAELLGRPISAEPDVALQLPPGNVNEELSAWLSAASDGAVVAMVPNGHLTALTGCSENQLVAAFAALGRTVLKAGFRLLLLAHDIRPWPGDPALARRIGAELPSSRSKVVVPVSAAEAKGLLAMCAGCLSARMHAAVAALSQGVPSFGLDYLDKFAGQFAWYGPAQPVAPATVLLADPRDARLVTWLDSLPEARADLAAHVPTLHNQRPRWLDS